MAKRKNTKNKKFKKYSIVVFIIAVIFSLIPPIMKQINGEFSWEDTAEKVGLAGNTEIDGYPMSVHFVDVGQGSCTLITSDFGTIMFDCGEKDQKEVVLDYLDNLNIEKIDYLIASHPHSDHIGCMSSVINHCEIGKFYMPELDESDIPTSKTYEHLLNALEKNNVDSSYMKSGDSFSLGEIECTALAPVEVIKGNINSMSIILKVEYKNVSFLLTGDAEKDEEKTVLDSGVDLSSDILCVGHHGSRTASSASFLKAVDPDIAVISCGKDNQYGHPHKETTQRLDKLGIKYYQTDQESTIIFSTDGEKIIDHQSGDKDE